MYCTFCFFFVAFVSVVSGSSVCTNYEFRCENGECIDSIYWCDSREDCSDGSDEKYCNKTNDLNSDPNKCPKTYFKCNDGPCIPVSGRCDGYNNCDDSSDEENCGKQDSTSKSENETSKSSISKKSKTTTRPSGVKKPHVKSISGSPKMMQLSDQYGYSELGLSDYSDQLLKAQNWLISRRKDDFGWGEETPRAVTALYLSDEKFYLRDDSELMMKQLEVLLSLDIARNGTKTMQLTDLALYINALMASCKDPSNFYGENLVRALRNSVTAAQRESKFVNPSVYLTLCINNATLHEDARRLQEFIYGSHGASGRIDIQALALLTATCMYRNSNGITSTVYESTRKIYFDKKNYGIPGNVYEASLHAQALHALKTSQTGLLDFILEQQQEDGSFGGILATYLVLPVLAGRSFLQLKEHCDQPNIPDFAPIEVLKNSKRRKIPVKYSLNYGNPPEYTETIEMQVPEGITFLDLMRLAENKNPKYRFMLDGNREIPMVYSIGGIPNDAEKGEFWTLYMASSSIRSRGEEGRFSLYTGNIKVLAPHPRDEFIFWMRSM